MSRRTSQHKRGWIWADGASGHCSSGKVCFPSRRNAHAAAKRLSGHLRPYLCECGFWHVGHLPHAARAGLMSASAVYQGASHG